MTFQSVDLQNSVRWWESATIGATAAAAVLTSIGAISGFLSYYRKKRPDNQILIGLDRKISFEKTFQVIGLLASIVALLGALCAVKYTVVNRAAQHDADEEKLKLQQKLQTAAKQSQSASETANAAARELSETRQQLSDTTSELAGADRELADAKDRLQRVENEQKWRTQGSGQLKKMIALLSKWKGSALAINPVANDNEVHEFAAELDSAFKKAGWKTVWAEFMDFATTSGVGASEGLNLQLPPEIKQYKDLENALIEAVKVADPEAEITYLSGDQPSQHAIHLEVYKKRHVTAVQHRQKLH